MTLQRLTTLNPGPKTKEKAFHKAVFTRYGYTCALCGSRACDAAHVIPRHKLGRHRYADPRLARPLCRDCHIKNTLGQKPFPDDVLYEATQVANQLLKVPLPLPQKSPSKGRQRPPLSQVPPPPKSPATEHARGQKRPSQEVLYTCPRCGYTISALRWVTLVCSCGHEMHASPASAAIPRENDTRHRDNGESHPAK
jgi:hypothetical protein